MVRRKRQEIRPAWNRKEHFRVICDCQRHSRKSHSYVRGALRLATRGAAVLVSIPLALAMFDIPTSAMNVNLKLVAPPVEKVRPAEVEKPTRNATVFPIFTTPAPR